MHARAHIKTSADARILSLACVVLPAFLHTIPQLEWEVTVASSAGALEQTQNRPVVGSRDGNVKPWATAPGRVGTRRSVMHGVGDAGVGTGARSPCVVLAMDGRHRPSGGVELKQA